MVENATVNCSRGFTHSQQLALFTRLIGRVYNSTKLENWLYVPMTVHREKNMKREDQKDATIRCLLLTSVSTCFGHHYAHLQEMGIIMSETC